MNRNGAGRTERSGRKIVRAWLMMLAALTVAGCHPSLPPPPAPLSAAEMVADVRYLGDPARGGRLAGSFSGREAAAYIARRFVEAGVVPIFPGSCADAGACPAVMRQTFRLHYWQISGTGVNVAGLVPGADPALRGEYVVVGAHYDHIGNLASLSLDPERSGVRPGADDNASGTAALLELARRLARRPARRSVLFVAFDAEELGLLGSAHFVADPPLPLDSAIAMLNLDMVGRLRRGRITIEGAAANPAWARVLEAANGDLGLDLRTKPPSSDSDQASFDGTGIPAIQFFTDLHPDYHTIGDRVERLNQWGMLRVVELAERVLREIGRTAGKPLNR